MRPDGSMLFVVDDASDRSVRIGGSFYRFEQQAGIPKAKNKCLELAYDAGADHIFLFDDDTYPIHKDWWKPYVESKEPHLMYQFRLPDKPLTDMRAVHEDEEIVAYTHTRGAMLYVERKVLDVVGGMDTSYGLGMYEHTDWTNRIHNAGLTTHRAMDVPNSYQLLYCLDQDARTQSSLPKSVKKRNLLMNRTLYHRSKTSSEFKEFRT
jgi:glycosyltransferase involved in cell wall biosynthesis